MKKLLVIIFVLVSTINLVALPAQITPVEMAKYLDLFEVSMDIVPLDGNKTFIFEDTLSNSTNVMLYRLSYLLNTLEFMYKDKKTTFSNSNIQLLTYTMFVIVDPALSKYQKPNLRYDVSMDRGWLLKYFASPSLERSKMLVALFNSYYNQWSPTQKSKI